MDVRHDLVGVRDDDGAGLDRVRVAGVPALSQTGEDDDMSGNEGGADEGGGDPGGPGGTGVPRQRL